MITISHATLALVVGAFFLAGMLFLGCLCAIAAKAWLLWEEVSDAIRFEFDAAANDRQWREAFRSPML